jgi:gas vesicle protein
MTVKAFLAGLAIGSLVGGAAGVLFAPKSRFHTHAKNGDAAWRAKRRAREVTATKWRARRGAIRQAM